jgi:hypothetical protein
MLLQQGELQPPRCWHWRLYRIFKAPWCRGIRVWRLCRDGILPNPDSAFAFATAANRSSSQRATDLVPVMCAAVLAPADVGPASLMPALVVCGPAPSRHGVATPGLASPPAIGMATGRVQSGRAITRPSAKRLWVEIYTRTHTRTHG